MGSGVTQRADQLIELDHRRRVAVRDQQRQCVRLRRTDVKIVDRLPVDLGDELRNLVESSLLSSPVEAVAPVIGQLLEVGQGYAAPEVCTAVWRGLGPAGRVEAAMEVIQLGVGDRDLERSECGSCCHPTTLEAIAEAFVLRNPGPTGPRRSLHPPRGALPASGQGLRQVAPALVLHHQWARGRLVGRILTQWRCKFRATLTAR